MIEACCNKNVIQHYYKYLITDLSSAVISSAIYIPDEIWL